MVKRLALLCCILLVPTIAAGQESNIHYGEWWIGAQLGAVINTDRSADVACQFGCRPRGTTFSTDPGITTGVIGGYNFCTPYAQVWERYFGVAVDFQWNQFDQPAQGALPTIGGNQWALAFLGRVQYPLGGDEKFTAGRFVPFLMAGPAIVWTNSDFSDCPFGDGSETTTDIAVVAEVGFEFFMWPHVSIGPSFRYRHVFGNGPSSDAIDYTSQMDQFMFLGRLAYHF